MFCSKCGAELEDKDLFCWKCGQPKKAATVEPPAQATYEYCSIVGYDDILLRRGWKAVVDRVVTRKTRKVSALSQSDYMPVHLELISDLSAQGWEPVATDRGGYVTSMRRVKRT